MIVHVDVVQDLYLPLLSSSVEVYLKVVVFNRCLDERFQVVYCGIFVVVQLKPFYF